MYAMWHAPHTHVELSAIRALHSSHIGLSAIVQCNRALHSTHVELSAIDQCNQSSTQHSL